MSNVRETTENAPRPESRRRSSVIFAILILLAGGLIIYVFSGRKAVDSIDGTYGRRSGTEGGRSVNGTGVLAAMFEHQGYRVSSWRWLSPKIDHCDVIVWAPDDFEPPTQEQRDRLERWLYEGYQNDRTLVYIGRDYDAETKYWKRLQPKAPVDQTTEVSRRLADAQSEHDLARAGMPHDMDSGWFTVQRNKPRHEVRALAGPWSDGVDASKVEITLDGRLEEPSASSELQFETLLAAPSGSAAAEDPLVTRVTFSDEWVNSQILVVANGSFLLNLPLVNHEHRRLAGKLIDECGYGERVIFLESGLGGPIVRENDDDHRRPTAMEMLGIWPLSGIVIHLAVLGIVMCFALFPIFGRPQELRDESRSDFSKHVNALGELLSRTNDYNYAQARLTHYHQRVKRDSGASHDDSKRSQVSFLKDGAKEGHDRVTLTHHPTENTTDLVDASSTDEHDNQFTSDEIQNE